MYARALSLFLLAQVLIAANAGMRGVKREAGGDLLDTLKAPIPLPFAVDPTTLLKSGPVGGLLGPVKGIVDGPLAPVGSLPVAGGLMKGLLKDMK